MWFNRCEGGGAYHHWTIVINAFSFIFSVGGSPHQLVLKLPVFINKFIEETVMGSADFFS